MKQGVEDTVYVVAVSGGVDSVVLLDMLAKRPDAQLVVAHFDHGIRRESSDDADFVADLARRYDVPFERRREALGAGASEELARQRRYAFLKAIARRHGGSLVTAHHADDVVETVAINLARGTGWRGLAALGDASIQRPLLGIRKQELLLYAQQNQLEWREDATNQQDVYLRNRLRQKLATLAEDDYWQVWRLWARQRLLAGEIDAELARVGDGDAVLSRYFLTHMPRAAALELLRHAVWQRSGQRPTRPQAERALVAVKVARAGAVHDVMANVRLRFSGRNYTIELT